MDDDQRYHRLEQLFDTLSMGQEQMLKQMTDLLQMMQRRKETGTPNPRSDPIAPTGELLSGPILTKQGRAEEKKVRLASSHLQSDAQIWTQKKKKLKPQIKWEEFKTEIMIHYEYAPYEDGFERLTTSLTRIYESRRNEGRCWAQDFKPNPSAKYWADPNHSAPTLSNLSDNRFNAKPPTPILRFMPSKIPPREREKPPVRAKKFFVGGKLEGEEVNDVVENALVNGDSRVFGVQKLLTDILYFQVINCVVMKMRFGVYLSTAVTELYDKLGYIDNAHKVFDEMAENPFFNATHCGWNVNETDETLNLRLDIPVLEKEDVKVVEQNTLVTRGRGDELEDEEERSDVLAFPKIIHGKSLKDSGMNGFVDDVVVYGRQGDFGEQEVLIDILFAEMSQIVVMRMGMRVNFGTTMAGDFVKRRLVYYASKVLDEMCERDCYMDFHILLFLEDKEIFYGRGNVTVLKLVQYVMYLIS